VEGRIERQEKERTRKKLKGEERKEGKQGKERKERKEGKEGKEIKEERETQGKSQEITMEMEIKKVKSKTKIKREMGTEEIEVGGKIRGQERKGKKEEMEAKRKGDERTKERM